VRALSETDLADDEVRAADHGGPASSCQATPAELALGSLPVALPLSPTCRARFCMPKLHPCRAEEAADKAAWARAAMTPTVQSWTDLLERRGHRQDCDPCGPADTKTRMGTGHHAYGGAIHKDMDYMNMLYAHNRLRPFASCATSAAGDLSGALCRDGGNLALQLDRLRSGVAKFAQDSSTVIGNLHATGWVRRSEITTEVRFPAGTHNPASCGAMASVALCMPQ